MTATGLKRKHETRVRYETHRERELGVHGAERQPIVEEFLGLDRARVAALGHALDGFTTTGDRFSGVIRIFQVIYVNGRKAGRTLIDVIDERVASRLLNETRLPRADQLAVSVDQLQCQFDRLMQSR